MYSLLPHLQCSFFSLQFGNLHRFGRRNVYKYVYTNMCICICIYECFYTNIYKYVYAYIYIHV